MKRKEASLDQSAAGIFLNAFLAHTPSQSGMGGWRHILLVGSSH